MKHIINTDLDPKLPFPGAEIVENIKMGEVDWDPSKFSFHFEPEQKTGYISGHTLYERLKGKPVVNASFMDYLEAHPDLVPDSWKKDEEGRTRYIYAWGTIFRDSDGSLCVRFWFWSGGALQSDYDWLGLGWDGRSPALVLVSSESLSSGPEILSSLELRVQALEEWRAVVTKAVSHQYPV